MAHPDDELTLSPLLAHYAKADAEVHLNPVLEATIDAIPVDADLRSTITMLAADLVGYQNEKLAADYIEFVTMVADAERMMP